MSALKIADWLWNALQNEGAQMLGCRAGSKKPESDQTMKFALRSDADGVKIYRITIERVS